ncbi:MAG: peptide chain release factor N(5)-glutamine methyltransferase [Bacilli bacterium]|nr:peptide chain release factor N(5)-glutamine methyltransferase [Bacilli bacterium]
MKNKIIELGYSSIEVDELLKVSSNIEEDYKKLLKKYPIQYLIGYVNFYGYKIYVNENVLIPRYETEYLVEKTINYKKKIFGDKEVKILDIGTGSGAIAIVLKKELNSKVAAIDISRKALEIAIKNAKENNCQINFRENNLLDNIEDKFDIIISNPPYISEDEKIMDSVDMYEPHIALYAKDDGLYYYEEILKKIKNNINKKYLIGFEIGWWQGNLIKSIALNYFKENQIMIEKDLSGKDRYLFIISE